MMTKQPTATNQSPPFNGDNTAKSSVTQSNEGRETIIPLRQRSILHRLDVYPFLIGYSLLIFGDGLLLHSTTNDGNINNSTVPIIAMDVGFIVLLILQLGLFLKCAWDPIWYAKVAYYWLLYNGGNHDDNININNNRNNNGSSSKEDGDDSVKWKIEQMKQWTHCLVIPPPPFDNSSNNNKQSGAKRTSSSSQVARSTERPGITPLVIEYQSSNNGSGEEDAGVVKSMVAVIPSFRGWTYRCCCNIIIGSSGGVEKIGVHTDLPMESIWYKESTGLKEIDDDDGISPKIASPSSSSSSSSTSWQPQFHRLHFPIDLALTFYIHTWKGHTTSHSITQTRSIYGPNATLIPLPPYIALLTEQLLQPLFLFQLFCVLLWSLDEYWIYALFTLGSIVMFECIQALNRWKSVKRLREEVVGGADGDGMNKKKKKQEMVECYRLGEWMSVPTDELVAGDVISLISPSIHSNQKKGRKVNTVIRKNAHDHNKGNTIPADLLLLNGRAVVNEAMLTGESVPQVKESIGGEVPEDNGGGECVQKLDLSEGSTHKRCVLFGGTVLMDHHSEEESGGDASFTTANNSIPSPPNDGIVCFVLRTGFDTIQGQLLRTMAYHAEGGGNSGGSEGVDSKETFYFLLILLLCALISAASVVDEAWGDVTRNHFKLVLHVIIIITSVIPPELPMELSLAVTTSLSELIKRFGIYCTEPFRIPLAGLVDTCCFDKTGTLTSDELRLHGVRLPSSQMGNSDICGDDDDLVLLDRSLSEQNDRSSDDNEGSSGDATIRSLLPHETLRVMVGCQSLAVTHAFVPGRDGRTTVSTELCGDPLEKAVLEGCGFTIHPSKNEIVEKESLMGLPSSSDGTYSMSILHRFAFSSKLRRMTTLAIENKDANATLWALTKGAPEAIQSMLDPKSLPSDYEESYLRHMKLGRRVLALAYRDLGSLNKLSQWKASRGKVEQNLQFAGLLIMDCPLKFDSKRVVKELRAGQQKVVMVTGDALLTAVEVARRVGIVDAPQEFTYALSKTDVGDFVFQPIGGGKNEATENCLSYSVSTIAKLRKKVGEGKAAVCITGDVLAKLAVSAIERASPEKGSLVIDERIALNHPAARTELALMAPIVSVFARHAPRHKEAVIAAFNASGSHTLMCGDGTNDVGALKQAHVGVSIISVPDLEAKQRSANETISAVRAEDKKERKSSKKRSKSGSKSSGKKPKQSRAERIERSLQALAEAEEELHYVSLGNASVASPFTSRKTSIRCCKDILQQGRCTLVTMIQIYKILGVNCLVNALVLTKLHQKGVKQGDRQMTAVGLVVAGLFLFVTRGKPLSKISPRKPPSSVLCKETLLSMTVQFAIHFVAIMTVTYMSDVYVDPYDPSAMVPDGPFNPNTLNTATFLVTVLATINTFVVNYRGRPFMENLTENKLLFRSLQACYAVLFVCALDIFPPLNQLLQLTPLPSTGPPSFNVNDVGQGGDVDSIQGMMLQAIDAIGFRLMLCVIMCLDTAFVTLSEKAIRSVMDG
ncbi:cation-transporting ATPase [Skeletonema marinoi]|uniref:Cation-transporting ATPase n=3 Tax=Skeletonema marinoi TaxID=267567 RepID=A0AAD8XU25_9STRA|nr:cation-transporting ATPase [Skeletonema marinoi]